MNRLYELGFLIPSNVPEPETQTVIALIQSWIEERSGTVTKIDYWGKRRLAYPINEFREAYYVFLHMDYPSAKLNELDYNLRLHERILRHLIVRLDE